MRRPRSFLQLFSALFATRAAASLAIALTLLGASACRKVQPKTKGVGDELRSFIIKNCASGKQYCQICAYGGKPTIMAVGELGDNAFEEDLVHVQKLLDAKQEKGLVAFALLGKFEGGALKTPGDEARALAELKAMRERLGLTFPVVILPSTTTEYEKRAYSGFNDSYEIHASRTIMFAAEDNKIVYSDVMRPGDAEHQFQSLEDVITKSL